MTVRMKIRHKFKFTVTASMLAFGGMNKGYAQNTSQAVMGVHVTVVSGSHVTNNSISNISDQLLQPSTNVSLGNLKLQISDGTNYLVKQSNTINMNGDQSNWILNTNMTQEKSKDGQVTLRMNGHTLSKVPTGTFVGRHITEVHYF